jgi:hypothetical protein
MFLSYSARRIGPCARSLTKSRALLALLGMLSFVSCTASPTLHCFLELPVYDAQGNRLNFEVSRVTAIEPPEKDDLLRSNGPHRMIWKDSRLYYSQGVYLTGIEVTLDGGKDSRGRSIQFTEKVALSDCQQRTSLQYGYRDAGLDVAATTVRGRISGCPLDGDWWIRAVPMFGAQASAMVVYEGYLHKSDGSFRITASMQGERHIVVIGRGRAPIASIGVDVVKGGQNNDVGTVDLRGKCPSP